MAKMLKTSAIGRKCAFPQCAQILSIYNHETYCHVHRGQGPFSQKPVVVMPPANVPVTTS